MGGRDQASARSSALALPCRLGATQVCSKLQGVAGSLVDRATGIAVRWTPERTMSELKNELMPLYGKRLKGLYLFGSYARGDARPDSDLDVLLVLDSIPSYSAEVDRTSELIARVSLDSGISVSRVFVSEESWLSQSSPFLANVRGEAVAA